MPLAMDAPVVPADNRLRVGDWTVEPDLNQLSAQGRAVKVEPKAMAVLLHLADRPGQVAGRDRCFPHAATAARVPLDRGCSRSRVARRGRPLVEYRPAAKKTFAGSRSRRRRCAAADPCDRALRGAEQGQSGIAAGARHNDGSPDRPVEVIRPFSHRVFADGGSTQERGLESGRKSLPRFRNSSAYRPTVAPARFSHRARQRKTALVGEVRSFVDRPLRHPGRARPEDRPHVAGKSQRSRAAPDGAAPYAQPSSLRTLPEWAGGVAGAAETGE